MMPRLPCMHSLGVNANRGHVLEEGSHNDYPFRFLMLVFNIKGDGVYLKDHLAFEGENLSLTKAISNERFSAIEVISSELHHYEK